MEYMKNIFRNKINYLIIPFLFFTDVCYATNIEKFTEIDKKIIKEMIKKAKPLIVDITGRKFKKK